MQRALCSKFVARIAPAILPVLALGASLMPGSAAAQVIPGRVVSASSMNQSRYDFVLRTFDESGNEVASDDWFEERTILVEQGGTQRCTRTMASWRESAGAPVQTSDQTRCDLVPENEFNTVMEVITGTYRQTEESPPGVVSSSAEETRSGSATFTLIAEFPTVPAGMRVSQVRVRPGFIGLTRPTDWMFPGSDLTQTGPPVSDPTYVSNCPNGLVTDNAEWLYPGSLVDANGRIEIGFAADPSCIQDVTWVEEDASWRSTVELNQRIADLTGQFTIEAELEPEPEADNAPPDCSAALAQPDRLWPPSGRFAKVAVTGVVDPDGDAVTVGVTEIRQDEPVLARGTRRSCPDAKLSEAGAARVRAERSGRGNGRVYVLSFSATDPSGDSCTGEVRVCVPHDARGSCVEDAMLHDSTRCGSRPHPRPHPHRGK